MTRRTAKSAWRAVVCAGALALAACNGGSRGSEQSAVRGDPDAKAASLKPSAPIAVAAPQPTAAGPGSAASSELAKAEPVASPAGSAPIDPQHARVAEALRYDPADPLADLEKADELDRGAARARGDNTPLAEAPKRGCVLDDGPRRIWPAPGVAQIAALGSDFVVAGYVREAAGERLFVVQLTAAGAATPVASLRVEPPLQGARAAGPGLAASTAQGVLLAYSDGAGVLFLQRLQVGASHGASHSSELARGVDPRFAPAVAYGKRAGLVAYTLGSTPMRSMLVRIDAKGELLGTHDITPAAMGAAAPAFVQGSEPLVIVTADARDGMSPIARTSLHEDGTPAATEVAAPVGMMSQPPQLTAAAASFGSFVGYTGMGSAATSAVGLVQILPKSGSPEALVKGTAYGTLHVAAAASSQLLFFAANTPMAPGKNPTHTVTLTRVDARGRGTPLSISSPSGDATTIALARAEDASLGMVWNGGDAIYFARARCDER